MPQYSGRGAGTVRRAVGLATVSLAVALVAGGCTNIAVATSTVRVDTAPEPRRPAPVRPASGPCAALAQLPGRRAADPVFGCAFLDVPPDAMAADAAPIAWSPHTVPDRGSTGTGPVAALAREKGRGASWHISAPGTTAEKGI
ncbi:hypothetical protein [Pseudonocardia sp. H11422]|uniref:hypothetical protein n=1 Tax=Pseudonocardia sp. H11422 TaxID=2835866 RepID=UPI001BDC2453|nr:hypothetical protein [Pseudonocardia sp. H11422]